MSTNVVWHCLPVSAWESTWEFLQSPGALSPHCIKPTSVPHTHPLTVVSMGPPGTPAGYIHRFSVYDSRHGFLDRHDFPSRYIHPSPFGAMYRGGGGGVGWARYGGGRGGGGGFGKAQEKADVWTIRKDLRTHPLMTQLQACNSPTDILAVLLNQVQQVERGDDKLTRWLSPTVNVLYAFAGVLNASVGSVSLCVQSLSEFSFNIIFLGILACECRFCWGWCPSIGAYDPGSPQSYCSDTELTQAAKDAITSQDALINIFQQFESFFGRLEIYTEAPTTHAMEDIIVKISVEVLRIFTIVTKEVREGESELIRDTLPVVENHSERYTKLIGRADIEDALSSLDRLTEAVARMVTAQVLKVAQQMANDIDEARRPCYLAPLLLVTESNTQGSWDGQTTTHGCPRRTHPLIKISLAALNMKGQPSGSSREIYPLNGSTRQPRPCCGSPENVRRAVPSCPPKP